MRGYSRNNIAYMLIGTKDLDHYQVAKDLYKNFINSRTNILFIEYDGDHNINERCLISVYLDIYKTK